jgi:hypothetical protein
MWKDGGMWNSERERVFTLKKVFCHKWESSFRDSAFIFKLTAVGSLHRVGDLQRSGSAAQIL